LIAKFGYNLVPISMKNAAKCDTQCELQERESSDL